MILIFSLKVMRGMITDFVDLFKLYHLRGDMLLFTEHESDLGLLYCFT